MVADPKSGKLYIRAKAGQPPIGVPARDIDKIERITPAIGTPDKGGVRPAIEFADKPARAPQYEIHTMTVRNGFYTTTYFYDTSLSPAERDQLSALERASDDVVQKSNTIESLSQAMQNAANDSGVTVAQGGYSGYSPYLAYPYYYPVAYYNLYYYLYYPMVPGYGYGGFPGYGYGGGGGNSTVVVRDSGSSGQSIAALTKSLTEARAALVEAQKTYVAVARRAIYDPSGQIVAVRLEE